MTKGINRKTSCFLSLFSIFMFSLSCAEKVSSHGQDPYEEVEWINTNALTIVLVRVTMLDPFSYAKT